MGRSETRSASVSAKNTDEPKEEFISKVCANVIKQLDENMNKKFETLGNKIDNLTMSMRSLDNSVVANTNAICNLNKAQDKIDQVLKRNSVRIEGLPEEEDEITVCLVADFIQKFLKINCTENDIDSAYRIESPRKNEMPKSILVRFVTNHKRNIILNAKKSLKQ